MKLRYYSVRTLYSLVFSTSGTKIVRISRYSCRSKFYTVFIEVKYSRLGRQPGFRWPSGKKLKNVKFKYYP